MTEGARRFGPHLLLWNILVLIVVFLVALLAVAAPPLGLAVALLLAVLYVLVPFVIVARTTTLSEALSTAPGALRRAWFGTWGTLAVLAVLGPEERYS